MANLRIAPCSLAAWLACLLCTACTSVRQLPGAGSETASEHPTSATAPSEEQLGVPYYPGSTPVGGGDTPDLVNGQFVTPDSIDKVVSFYKGNIREAVATGDKNEAMIEFKKGDVTYSIDIHRKRREAVTLIQINARK